MNEEEKPNYAATFEGQVIKALAKIETTLDAIDKTVNGNGEPGLVGKYVELEKRLTALETQDKTKTNTVANVLNIVAWLIAMGFSAYTAFIK
jgi:hypothetical protein